MPRLTLTPEEEHLNLAESVALANDYSGHKSTWKGKRYGPDEAEQFRRLLHAFQEWQEVGSRNISAMNLEQRDREGLEKYTTRIRLIAERNGTFSAVDPTPWNEALFQFVRLLNNSEVALLGGPCRNRKKHGGRDFWFVRETRRASVFCSRHCAGDATKANERERARIRKIDKAKRAMRNYSRRPARFKDLTWQEFVIRAEPSLSKRFLTTAVQTGHLVPPKSTSFAGRPARPADAAHPKAGEER